MRATLAFNGLIKRHSKINSFNGFLKEIWEFPIAASARKHLRKLLLGNNEFFNSKKILKNQFYNHDSDFWHLLIDLK